LIRPDGCSSPGPSVVKDEDEEEHGRNAAQTDRSGLMDGNDRALFCANDRTVIASRPLSGCVRKHDAPRRRHRDAASADTSVRPTMTIGTVASTARSATISASLLKSTSITTTCTWAGTSDSADWASSTAHGTAAVPTSEFAQSSASTPYLLVPRKPTRRTQKRNLIGGLSTAPVLPLLAEETLCTEPPAQPFHWEEGAWAWGRTPRGQSATAVQSLHTEPSLIDINGLSKTSQVTVLACTSSDDDDTDGGEGERIAASSSDGNDLVDNSPLRTTSWVTAAALGTSTG